MTTLYTLLIDVKEDYLLFFMILKVSKRSAAQHRGHRTQDTARKEVRLSFLLKKIRPIFKWSRFVHLRVPADNCGFTVPGKFLILPQSAEPIGLAEVSIALLVRPLNCIIRQYTLARSNGTFNFTLTLFTLYRDS
jgi:hypothetical protein